MCLSSDVSRCSIAVVVTIAFLITAVVAIAVGATYFEDCNDEEWGASWLILYGQSYLCSVLSPYTIRYCIRMNVVWTWIDKHITILSSFCVMRNYSEQIIIFLHNEFQLKQCYSKDCMPGSVANSSFLLHNSPVKTNIICSVVLHFKLPSHSSFVLKGLSTLQWIRILLPFNHKKWEITDWNTVACRADHRSLNP